MPLHKLHGQMIDSRACDTISQLSITNYTYFLQDSLTLNIDSVVSCPDRFTKSPYKPVQVYNYDPYYYWYRIVVHNESNLNDRFMLLMAPMGLYDGVLYQRRNSNWEPVAHSGLKYRFKERSYQFTHHVYPFQVGANQTDTLYLFVNANNVYKAIGFALLRPATLKSFENRIYFVFGIITGLLILFAILNLSMYLAIKEKIHLWYALYIVFLFLILIKNDQLDQEIFGWDTELAFRLTPYMTIGAIAISILLHVVQQFLTIALDRNTLLYRFSNIVKYNMLASAVAHFMIFFFNSSYRLENTGFFWAKYSTFLGVLTIIVLCIYAAFRGMRSALLVLCATLLFLIGSLQRLFVPSTISFLFPPTTFHIGIIAETFIISVALIYRYWRDKHLQRLMIQYMSEEIHDNIANSLVLARLQLKSILNDNSKAHPDLSKGLVIINKSIEELRNLSRTTKVDEQYQSDLFSLVRNECKIYCTPGFDVNFHESGNVVLLGAVRHMIIVRMVQEVLQNAAKHARCSKVDVSVAFEKHNLKLDLADNGIGFDEPLVFPTSNGLRNIKRRCLSLHGKCEIQTSTGKGTRFIITVPLRRMAGLRKDFYLK